MEHNRWMAEKLLAGWTVGRERNDGEKRHDALMPWDSLPENERAKDRAAVRHMPACLARIGKEIVRQI